MALHTLKSELNIAEEAVVNVSEFFSQKRNAS
jgi:hypothetical protein